MVKVAITPKAQKELNRITPTLRVTVVRKINDLRNRPNVSEIKRLKGGRWGDAYRRRAGDYRIIFQWVGGEIWVVKIGDRKDVYE